jgi:hypothetical protein
MKTKRYFLTTWCVANVLHPFLYMLWLKIDSGEAEMETGFVSMLTGFVFSAPALMMCFLLFSRLKKLSLPVKLKFVLWILLAMASIPLTIFPIFVLLNDVAIFFQLGIMFLPGCLSALIAVAFRHKTFFYLITQTKENESNLV